MNRITSVAEFNEFIRQGYSIVNFYADWCGKCKELSPILESISKEQNGARFIRVNIDHFVALTNLHEIQSIPTLILFFNGKEVRRQSGAMTKGQVEKFIKG